MYISINMKRLSRHLITLSSLALTLSCAYAQLVPGQLPNTPAAPGQVDQDTKKPAAPAQPPSTFTPPPSRLAADNAQKSDFNITTQRVLVPTTVLDPDGHGYVNGLQASDFEVLDNDKPQRVQAEITEQPMSVVLVVQANSAVEYMLPKIRKTGILLHGLVTGQDGDIAVLAFDHEMHHILDFTSDPDKIDDAMQKIRAGSSTAALIDAITDADHMLVRHDPLNKRRRVILLMSTNVDKGSQMHLDEAVRQLGEYRRTAPSTPLSAASVRSSHSPRQPGVMRPSGSTAVASVQNMPAPDSARAPICMRCHADAAPLSAEYWHMGETTMRLGRRRPRNASGENRALMGVRQCAWRYDN